MVLVGRPGIERQVLRLSPLASRVGFVLYLARICRRCKVGREGKERGIHLCKAIIGRIQKH